MLQMLSELLDSPLFCYYSCESMTHSDLSETEKRGYYGIIIFLLLFQKLVCGAKQTTAIS